MSEIWYLVTTLCMVQFYTTDAAKTYVSCLSCPDVASPRYCQQTMTCGKGEICYAKEYQDHKGLTGYRLGCEDEARCNIYLNAKLLFGKRNIPDNDPASPEKCYECCSGDECNGRLCQGGWGGGVHVLQTYPTTTSAPSCTCPTTHQVCPSPPTCPKRFIQHKDRCYLFATWSEEWSEAREFCKRQGADLVSINSQEEQEYLVKELNVVEAHTIFYFFTGGWYNQSKNAWEWVDKSPVQYTNWYPGFPEALLPNILGYIALMNPSSSRLYNLKTGPWQALILESQPFICEKPIAK